MTNVYKISAVLVSFLAAGCSGNSNSGESQTARFEKNDRVLNMTELFDISESEATQKIQLISSPFEVMGRARVERGFNSEPQYVILEPCIEASRSERLEEEFNSLSGDAQKSWLKESQGSGKLGWAIGGRLSNNILVSEVLDDKENEALLSVKYILIDKISEIEAAENQCSSFSVKHIEGSTKQEFAETQIGQVLVMGINTGSE